MEFSIVLLEDVDGVMGCLVFQLSLSSREGLFQVEMQDVKLSYSLAT